MKRMRRCGFGAIGLVVLASCVAPAERPAPVTVPPPPPSAPAEAPPVPPGDFTLAGDMTQGGLVLGTAPPGTVKLLFDGKPVAFASDRRFVIAFDRDAGPAATIAAVTADGRTVSRTLAVSPRAWPLSRLSTLPKYPVPMPRFEQLRPAELAQIAAARARDTGADGWRQPFLWPATGRISTMFGSQRIYRNGEKGAYHSGTDVAVPVGTPVVAPADGVVVLATDQPFTLEGNLLMIDHGMGLNSALMHLSRIVVRPGDAVRRGQLVAYSGSTGRATGPHLHWSLRWHDARIDPLLVAGPMAGER